MFSSHLTAAAFLVTCSISQAGIGVKMVAKGFDHTGLAYRIVER